MENIHPIFDTMLPRGAKESMLKQRAKVIWMIGLSGSGKSTLAKALEHDLHAKGFLTKLLDGDNMRSGINGNLGFSAEDREENIRRTAETAKLFADTGIVTICSFISPTEDLRRKARSIIGADYYEVYVNAPLEVCEQRDVKGLYKKARAGEIKNFTGISAPFEAPERPDLEVRTDLDNIASCRQKLAEAVLPLITFN